MCIFWSKPDGDDLVQDSDFLYLTGISQQAVAVLESSSSRAGGRLTLFISDATPQVANLGKEPEQGCHTLHPACLGGCCGVRCQ